MANEQREKNEKCEGCEGCLKWRQQDDEPVRRPITELEKYRLADVKDDTFAAGYEAALQDFRDELNCWVEHSARGMGKGNPVYFQGRIGLIVNLWDYVKGLEEKLNAGI